MSPKIRKSRSAFVLAYMSLPLIGGATEGGLEIGASLKLQHPLGEYQSTIVDAGLGYGLGLRGRYKIQAHHALTARMDYDWFPEGSSEEYGTNYFLAKTSQVREMALGLNYEWVYSGGTHGGYLLAGPTYRRWQDRREYDYQQTRPGTVPASQTISTSPTGLGFDAGWGYRGSSNSAIELHVISSKYGDSGVTANSLQVSFIQYW